MEHFTSIYYIPIVVGNIQKCSRYTNNSITDLSALTLTLMSGAKYVWGGRRHVFVPPGECVCPHSNSSSLPGCCLRPSFIYARCKDCKSEKRQKFAMQINGGLTFSLYPLLLVPFGLPGSCVCLGLAKWQAISLACRSTLPFFASLNTRTLKVAIANEWTNEWSGYLFSKQKKAARNRWGKELKIISRIFMFLNNMHPVSHRVKNRQ